MEALLIDEWLDDDAVLFIYDDASVSIARERVRELGREAELPTEVVESLVVVASELARNQLVHASGGRMAVRHVTRAGVRGLEIAAADRGGGILDPRTALEGRPRASGSLGVGLASVSELAFELDFDSRVGEGTCIWARKFAGSVPRRRQVGIYGRPHVGEPRSGDHGCFFRGETYLTVGVCDGLGHGALARAASSVALETFRESAERSPLEVIEACHQSLHRTRGAVMAVARVEEDAERIELASVGNIGTHVCGLRTCRRFCGSSFVLGAPQRVRKVHSETTPLARRELLVMFTDGVTSRLALEDELELLREHPVVIAQEVVRRFAREDDDALVLVAA
jgi:anti-sigma regulatory factor (Ser/Thr protein kinase)